MRASSNQPRRLLALACGVAFASCRPAPSPEPDPATVQIGATFRHCLLIGWDGVRRQRLELLRQAGKLPNLERVVRTGRFVDITITSGATDTKAGWAQILTGQDPERTRVWDNHNYAPLARGSTLLERLEQHFGDAGITTVFLAGKQHNLGARGPHRICLNCRRDRWYDEREATPLLPDQAVVWKEMLGEPYYLTHEEVDVFENGLGGAENVGARVLDLLARFARERLLLFAEFGEPDRPSGHGFGEASPEYAEDLVMLDRWLGRILDHVATSANVASTLIYVTSDHGFDAGGNEHFSAPDVFLATTDPAVKSARGDRKDIAPTIVERFGVDLATAALLFDGRSLLGSTRP